jgi:hypothetical protein
VERLASAATHGDAAAAVGTAVKGAWTRARCRSVWYLEYRPTHSCSRAVRCHHQLERGVTVSLPPVGLPRTTVSPSGSTATLLRVSVVPPGARRRWSGLHLMHAVKQIVVCDGSDAVASRSDPASASADPNSGSVGVAAAAAAGGAGAGVAATAVTSTGAADKSAARTGSGVTSIRVGSKVTVTATDGGTVGRMDTAPSSPSWASVRDYSDDEEGGGRNAAPRSPGHAARAMRVSSSASVTVTDESVQQLIRTHSRLFGVSHSALDVSTFEAPSPTPSPTKGVAAPTEAVASLSSALAAASASTAGPGAAAGPASGAASLKSPTSSGLRRTGTVYSHAMNFATIAEEEAAQLEQ